MKIGVVGNGFVGNAVFENMKEKYDSYVYDKDINKSLNTIEEVYSCDIIFVCLPTPMRSADGGECNLTIIEDFFSQIPKEINGIFAIKSTVPIGTTEKLRKSRKDLRIVHNPEFLTAANAKQDFKNSERNVIGGAPEDCKVLENCLKNLLPKTENILVTSTESEAIKYFSNTFLATKVAYFNLIYDLCQKLNIDYNSVVSGVCSDTRIGKSHSKTPGPDGDRGFGGTCFPKDLNALIHTFKENNLDNVMLQNIWKYNKKIRKKWDWAENKSAVLDGE